MLRAGLHVGLTDPEEALLAEVKRDHVFEEEGNGILLLLGLSAKVSSLLRNLLAEPNRLSDTVLPVITLEHHPSNLILLRLFFFDFLLHRFIDGSRVFLFR